MAKTAIVTGATAGIGKEVARKLTEKGYRVVLACRRRSAALAVKRELLDTIPKGLVDVGPPLDLSSIATIRTFVAALGNAPVSLLVNNAGCNVASDQLSNDGLPLNIQVNYVGPYLLTRLLIPLLEKSVERPRVVNVASVMHRFADISTAEALLQDGVLGDYSDSKLALVMFSHEFHTRHGDTIDICCVDPGSVYTKIFDGTAFRYPPFGWGIRLCYATPEDGAMPIMHAIEADETPSRSAFYARGMFASDWLTHYRGYRRDLLGRVLYLCIALAAAIVSLWDYPLRCLFSNRRFHETREVPPMRDSLNPKACSALWNHTEAFLNL